MKLIKSIATRNRVLKSSLIAFVSACLVSTSQATTTDFTGGNSSTDGADGNLRTFGSIGASAQSSVTGNDPWIASYLGWYSTGLGVTNDWETGSSPSHTVDNLNGYDRVVLDFGASVVLDKVGLTAFGDTDINVYYYSGSAWSLLETNSGSSVNRTADVNSGLVAASKWAIGAGIPSGNNDDFKISNVTWTSAPPPPPVSAPDSGSTLVLLSIGTGLLFLLKKGHASRTMTVC
jgi:hypothetical protein